jgi:AGZA family xanthine/uracil permease-like MFS transporter
MLERLFHIQARDSTVWREFLGGVVTFMTMSYIIFVNPTILSAAGMDFDGAVFATCMAAGIATLVMGLVANYPIAQAPGMGLNAYFAYTVVLGMGIKFDAALGAVFFSGISFIILTIIRVRALIVDALPHSVKKAIAAGIGLFIAFIGLKEAGIVQFDINTLVRLADVTEPPALLAIFGLVVTAVMMVWRVRGAILWGILLTAVVGLLGGVLTWQGFMDPAPKPTLFLKMDLAAAFDLGLLNVIFIFLFIDMFDTLGTLVGVTDKAGLMKPDGSIPGINRALLSDGIGTSVGAVFGTSTVTSYIESAAGITAGARTGLSNIFTAALFFLALFFTPLARTIGAGVPVEQFTAVDGTVAGAPVAGMFTQTSFLHPVTAPALIIVGSLMLTGIREIKWDEPVEAIPAFLTMIAIPLTFSIANGITLGFISYPVVMICAGRWRDVSPLAYVLALLFIGRFIFLMS